MNAHTLTNPRNRTEARQAFSLLLQHARQAYNLGWRKTLRNRLLLAQRPDYSHFAILRAKLKWSGSATGDKGS